MKKIKIQSTISGNKEAQREFINGLVLSKDWNYWRDPNGTPVFPEAIRLMAARNDRDFFEHLGKALYEGRCRKNALLENFIRLHWDELKSKTADDATDLLNEEFPKRLLTANSYRKTIRKLGLLAK